VRPGPLDQASPGGTTRFQAGQKIHGVIDWARRFDHMQQHTGQHVLSAAFDRLFSDRTMSFHLGSDASTIDLARELTLPDLIAAEDEANRIVWENRAVTVRFASAEEAARLPLRKESARAGALRLIDVDGFDLSACGGTHVARTGEIGVISIGAWERFKGGQRLAFHCGGRAVRRLRALGATAAAGARLLSVPPADVPDAIQRQQAEAKEQRRALAALQSELTRYRAAELAARAEPTVRGRLVAGALEADAGTLKTLASAMTEQGGLIVVLVSTARPALVAVSRSADVNLSSSDVLARLTAKFGGRGGGKPELAQGGGLDAPPDAILEEARRVVIA
jgi:alanyl-tRNA synthetase